jgi:hypothetical protein
LYFSNLVTMIPPEDQHGEKTIHLSARGFKESLHKRLKIESVKRGVPIGDLLNEIVEEWLKRNEDKAK